jgi:hypothetical protein
MELTVAGHNQNEPFSPKQSLPVPVQFRHLPVANTQCTKPRGKL